MCEVGTGKQHTIGVGAHSDDIQITSFVIICQLGCFVPEDMENLTTLHVLYYPFDSQVYIRLNIVQLFSI